MLSEKPPKLEALADDGYKFNDETRIRQRRLNDVNRGKYYFQRLDKLADNYWNNNNPVTKPSTKSRLRPITDSFYSKQYEKRRMQQQLAAQKHNEKLDDVCKKRVQSETFLLSKEYRDKKRASQKDEVLYNQWGSSLNPLDEKLILKKEDFESKFEPFRFRDSVKHVLKPIPKKPVVMSRVGRQSPNRQLKRSRNFSSDNGTVNIIRPVDPAWPEPEENMASYFNPEELEKENTFAILDRIDKILHPVKYNLLKERGSSEENEPPSVAENASDISDALYPGFQKHEPEIKTQPRQDPKQKLLPNRNKHFTVDPSWKRHNHKQVVYIKRSQQKSLASVIEKLELCQMDAFKKCQLWIVKCKAANWYLDQ